MQRSLAFLSHRYVAAAADADPLTEAERASPSSSRDQAAVPDAPAASIGAFFRIRPLAAGIGKMCGMAAVVAIAAGLTLALPGCGFQPREALTLPGSIEVRGGSFELRDALNARLTGSGARPAAEGADIVLDVRAARFDERLLTMEPLAGGAVEYRISYHVRYTVKDRSGKPLLDPGEVELLREYRVHTGERASRGRERAHLHAEMHRTAAAAILRRLHALSGG